MSELKEYMYYYSLMQKETKNGADRGTGNWQDRIDVQLVLVTPEMAEVFLQGNEGNYRSMRNPHKIKMVTDMINNDWSFTNATIAFDVDDRLVDGQHRLSAIVESGTCQWFLIVLGMPRGSQKNPAVDTGARRSVATHLKNDGIANAAAVAATARMLWCFRDGIYARTENGSISDSKIAAIIGDNPSIIEAAGAASRCRAVARASATGALYWFACKKDKELADKCIEILGGFADSLTSHPFAKCREVFLKAKSEKKTDTTMTQDLQYRYLLSAWQKSLIGEPVKLLRPAKESIVPEYAKAALQKLF